MIGALVGLVALGVYLHLACPGFHVSASKGHPETDVPSVPESVLVSQNAVRKEGGRTGDDSIVGVLGQRLIHTQSSCEGASTADVASRPSWVRSFDIGRGVIQIVNSNFHLEYDVDGRSLPYVAEFEKNGRLFANLEAFDPRTSHVQIGPQLTFSGFVRPANESRRSEPQHPSNNYQQPFARLHSKERDLRSVLLTLGMLWGASALYWRGWRVTGGALAAFALLGLLLADWWSLLMWVLPVGY